MPDDLDDVLGGVRVADEVLALRPDFVAAVVVADGLRAGPTDDTTRALLADAAATAQGVDPAHEPHLASWRAAYSAFGAKPSRTRNSAEALLRRAAAGLPEVNALVDVYNAVSVRHRIPVGGEDLDAYAGRPRLVRARGDERFETVANGEPADEHPDPGEVVWRDDAGVTCRRWNHRQCVRTRITATTTRALFVLERLDPLPVPDLLAAADDLTAALRARSGDAVLVRRRLLGAAAD